MRRGVKEARLVPKLNARAFPSWFSSHWRKRSSTRAELFRRAVASCWATGSAPADSSISWDQKREAGGEALGEALHAAAGLSTCAKDLVPRVHARRTSAAPIPVRIIIRARSTRSTDTSHSMSSNARPAGGWRSIVGSFDGRITIPPRLWTLNETARSWLLVRVETRAETAMKRSSRFSQLSA